MTHQNQTLLLRDEGTEPTDRVLENSLGKDLFIIYQKLMQAFTDEFDLEPQWRYYNDGKAWLCKVTSGKKTILWLSAWENLIKTSFYFTGKTRGGVLELVIDQKIKEVFSGAKPVGKLIPLVMDIDRSEQIDDLKTIIKFKKSLK
jgi:hypothetical protein